MEKVRIFVLVATMALLGMLVRGPSIVMAQGAMASPSDQPTFDVSKLDGIERCVSRAYLGDMSAMMQSAGTPRADGKDPGLSSLGLFSLDGIIVQFKDDRAAKNSFGATSSEAMASMTSNDPVYAHAA